MPPPQTNNPPGPASPAPALKRLWGKPLLLVLLELFVAVSLTVNFFYLVRPQCLPKRSGNMLSALSFSYLSDKVPLSPDDILHSWRTRLLTPIISGRLLDSQLTETVSFEAKKYRTFQELCRSAQFQNIFGLYHSLWLFLVFLTLIIFRKDALLIILGVFAGLMYNLTDAAGSYYYPWDMPAMFFFSLACLLYDRRKIGLLLPVVVLGGLCKETVLCCSLLVLLEGHWNWPKRITGFLVVVLAVFGLNRLLMAHYGVNTGMLTMNSAHTTADLFQTGHLFENIRALFSMAPNHLMFANGGALLLMMVIPWRNRRDILFKLMIVIFAAGQFLFGVINEVRVWYELLPLGWMLVGEAVARRWPGFLPGNPDTPTEADDDAHRLRKASYWLVMGLLLVIALGIFGVAAFKSPPPPVDAKSDAEYIQGLITAAETGNPAAQFKLALTYEDRQDYNAAIPWLEKAAGQGLVEAEYNLGVVYFNVQHDSARAAEWFVPAAAAGHAAALYSLGLIYWEQQKYDQAIPLFQQSAQKGDMYGQWMLGNIYLKAKNADPVEAYKWFKLAQLQGFNAARLDLKKCSDSMTAEQIADAEKRAKEFQPVK